MMKLSIKWPLVLALASVAVIMALNLIGIIKIAGRLSSGVYMEPPQVSIDVSKICRERQLVAKLRVESPVGIQFTVREVKYEVSGNFSAVSGLTVTLAGPRTYSISMPCVLDIPRGSCLRPMIIIPGFDAPLQVEPGVYDVYIGGECSLRGAGEARVEITLAVMAG